MPQNPNCRPCNGSNNVRVGKLPLVDDIFRFWNPLVLLLVSLVCDIGDILHDNGEFTDCPNIPIFPSVFIDATDDADGDGTIPVPATHKKAENPAKNYQMIKYSCMIHVGIFAKGVRERGRERELNIYHVN